MLAILASGCTGEGTVSPGGGGANDAASMAPLDLTAVTAVDQASAPSADLSSSRDLARGPDGGGGGRDGGTMTGMVPINDLANGMYLGFTGGLYPGGSNAIPMAHLMAGIAAARKVQPLDGNGNPDAQNGKSVLLSIGMSNTTQEFCGNTQQNTVCPCMCDAFTFMGQAMADNTVETAHLVMVNGAMGGQTAIAWAMSSNMDYDLVRDNRLKPAGVTEKQVQVVWLKVADATPMRSLPAMNADAYALESLIGQDLRALKTRYPNLRLAFLSSRIYAGYASTNLNPEPYAYESGFSVKWAIEAQINQMQGGMADARAGNLDYNSVAPWIGWGPYLWADGLNARSDGLTWETSDLANDGTHPATSGRRKVGRMLLDFFKAAPTTKCWFLKGGACP